MTTIHNAFVFRKSNLGNMLFWVETVVTQMKTEEQW